MQGRNVEKRGAFIAQSENVQLRQILEGHQHFRRAVYLPDFSNFCHLLVFVILKIGTADSGYVV